MKYLPNLLTMANLVSGCIAIAYILNAQPFVSAVNGMEYWVLGAEQPYWGAWFILFAAIFDVLDGLAARALNVFSPVGNFLDSLADVVSFGVAPSMILFKMLWGTYMSEPDAWDVSMLAMAPAFIFTCAGAYRLARFNTGSPSPKGFFQGMPIPAAGLFVASFALINWYQPQVGIYLQNKWLLYAIIALLSWLMVSRISFFKLIPASFSPATIWPQLLLVVAGIVSVMILKAAAVLPVFALYIILSFVYKPKES